MEELTKEWVEKAENDLATADLALHAGNAPISDTACFHCQQCVEKYLKAFLQENHVPFLSRHNLIPLLNLCSSLDLQFEDLHDACRQLESFSVAVRYPGLVITVEEAEKAFNIARQVRIFIRRKLSLK